MKLGIAADHGGYDLKGLLLAALRELGHEVVDFGAYLHDPEDDFPDLVVPLARAVARHDVERGIAICGSGIGAAVAACKVPGVRAGLAHDVFSAHQGVEDDDMNVLCLGGRVVGPALALDLVRAFVSATFRGLPRHHRRLAKIAELERCRAGGDPPPRAQ